MLQIQKAIWICIEQDVLKKGVGEEKEKIVFESTYNLKGPRYLAKKNLTTECAIGSILWDFGLKANPNDWNNLDFNNYPRRSRNMELFVYI